MTSILYGAITQKNKWQIQRQQGDIIDYPILICSTVKIRDNVVLKDINKGIWKIPYKQSKWGPKTSTINNSPQNILWALECLQRSATWTKTVKRNVILFWIMHMNKAHGKLFWIPRGTKLEIFQTFFYNLPLKKLQIPPSSYPYTLNICSQSKNPHHLSTDFQKGQILQRTEWLFLTSLIHGVLL